MALVRFARTYRGAQAVFAVARCLPRPVAYAISDRLLARVARQSDTPYVRGLRSNLAVLLDLAPNDPELDRAAARAFRMTGRGYTDFVRAAAHGAQGVAECCRFGPSMRDLLEQAQAENRGLVMVGAHLCGFDFELIAMKRWYKDLLVLGQPQPTGSSALMNDLRRRLGLEVAPISRSTLREAVNVLRRGGMVGLAADVPVPDGEPLVFLGRRAHLPTGHARLALTANVGMVLGVCHRAGPDDYEILGEAVPCASSSLDHHHAAREWAQSCLHKLEFWLRQWPDQWMMPFSIWEPLEGNPRVTVSPG